MGFYGAFMLILVGYIFGMERTERRFRKQYQEMEEAKKLQHLSEFNQRRNRGF